MPMLEIDSDLQSVRSDVLRSSQDEVVLAMEGRRILVLRFARTVFSFHNIGQIETAIETRVEARADELAITDAEGHDGGTLVAVVLDVSSVEEVQLSFYIPLSQTRI